MPSPKARKATWQLTERLIFDSGHEKRTLEIEPFNGNDKYHFQKKYGQVCYQTLEGFSSWSRSDPSAKNLYNLNKYRDRCFEEKPYRKPAQPTVIETIAQIPERSSFAFPQPDCQKTKDIQNEVPVHLQLSVVLTLRLVAISPDHFEIPIRQIK